VHDQPAIQDVEPRLVIDDDSSDAPALVMIFQR
jgi:hypothetical protein